MLPSIKTATLSDKYSASSKNYVVNINVFPSAFSYSIISQIILLEFGSIPEVGSSRIIIYDPPMIALARLSFLLFPPLKFFAKTPL